MIYDREVQYGPMEHSEFVLDFLHIYKHITPKKFISRLLTLYMGGFLEEAGTLG